MVTTGHWAVEDKTSGNFIGRIGFLQPEGWPEFEIGWLLARDNWGTGLAQEGASACLQYAKESLNKTTLVSIIHIENHASKKLATKLGAAYESNTQIMGFDVEIYHYPSVLIS